MITDVLIITYYTIAFYHPSNATTFNITVLNNVVKNMLINDVL